MVKGRGRKQDWREGSQTVMGLINASANLVQSAGVEGEDG